MLKATKPHEGVAGGMRVGWRAVAQVHGVGVTVLTVVSSLTLQASPK